jgi:hypothetical protein
MKPIRAARLATKKLLDPETVVLKDQQLACVRILMLALVDGPVKLVLLKRIFSGTKVSGVLTSSAQEPCGRSSA